MSYGKLTPKTLSIEGGGGSVEITDFYFISNNGQLIIKFASDITVVTNDTSIYGMLYIDSVRGGIVSLKNLRPDSKITKIEASYTPYPYDGSAVGKTYGIKLKLEWFATLEERFARLDELGIEY